MLSSSSTRRFSSDKVACCDRDDNASSTGDFSPSALSLSILIDYIQPIKHIQISETPTASTFRISSVAFLILSRTLFIPVLADQVFSKLGQIRLRPEFVHVSLQHDIIFLVSKILHNEIQLLFKIWYFSLEFFNKVGLFHIRTILYFEQNPIDALCKLLPTASHIFPLNNFMQNIVILPVLDIPHQPFVLA